MRLQVVVLLLCLSAGAFQQPDAPGPPDIPSSSDQATQAAPASAPVASDTITLHDGEPVVLRNLDPITSAKAKTGDQVKFEVAPGRYWISTTTPGTKLSASQQDNQMVVLDAVAGTQHYVEVAFQPARAA